MRISEQLETTIINGFQSDYDLETANKKLSSCLNDDEKVLYYIPGSKMTHEFFFTTEKLVIGERMPNEWGKGKGGDILLTYDKLDLLEIQSQKRVFFIKLDLHVKFGPIDLFVKKRYSEVFWALYHLIKDETNH